MCLHVCMDTAAASPSPSSHLLRVQVHALIRVAPLLAIAAVGTHRGADQAAPHGQGLAVGVVRPQDLLWQGVSATHGRDGR